MMQWRKKSLTILLLLIATTVFSGDPFWGVNTDTRDRPYYFLYDSLYFGRFKRIGPLEMLKAAKVDSLYIAISLPQHQWNWSSWKLHMIPIDSVKKVVFLDSWSGYEELSPFIYLTDSGVYYARRESMADTLTWRALLGDYTEDRRFHTEKGLEWGSWPPKSDSLWKSYLLDTVKRQLDSLNLFYSKHPIAPGDTARLTAVEVWNEPYDGGYQYHVVYPYYRLFVRNPPPGYYHDSLVFARLVYKTPNGRKLLEIKLTSIHDIFDNLTWGYLERNVIKFSKDGDTLENFTDTLKVFSNEHMFMMVRDSIWTPAWYVKHILTPVWDIFHDAGYRVFSGAFAYAPGFIRNPPGEEYYSQWYNNLVTRWYDASNYRADTIPHGVTYWIEEFLKSGGQDKCDGFTFHFYVTSKEDPDSFDPYYFIKTALDTWAIVLDRYGWEKPVWVTEFGAHTDPNPENFFKTLIPSARNCGHFLNVFHRYRKNRNVGIKHVCYYNFRGWDFGIFVDDEDKNVYFKPVYYVFKNYADGLRDTNLLLWDSLSTEPAFGENLLERGYSEFAVFCRDSAVFLVKRVLGRTSLVKLANAGSSPDIIHDSMGEVVVVYKEGYLPCGDLILRYRGKRGASSNLITVLDKVCGPFDCEAGLRDRIHLVYVDKEGYLTYRVYDVGTQRTLREERISPRAFLKGQITTLDLEIFPGRPDRVGILVVAKDTLSLFLLEERGIWNEVLTKRVSPGIHADHIVDPEGNIHIVYPERGGIRYLAFHSDRPPKGGGKAKVVGRYVGDSPSPRLTLYKSKPIIVWSTESIVDYPFPKVGTFEDRVKNIVVAMEVKRGKWKKKILYLTKVHSLYPEVAVNSKGMLSLLWVEGRFGVFRLAFDDTTIALVPSLRKIIKIPKVLQEKRGDSLIYFLWEYRAPSLTPQLTHRALLIREDGSGEEKVIMKKKTDLAFGVDTVVLDQKTLKGGVWRIELQIEDRLGSRAEDFQRIVYLGKKGP